MISLTSTAVSVSPPCDILTNNHVEPNPVNLPYGGVNPTVQPMVEQPENKVIYGGANPLTGTEPVLAKEVSEVKKPEDIESL